MFLLLLLLTGCYGREQQVPPLRSRGFLGSLRPG